MSLSLCRGVGVKRNRSVPRGTVGRRRDEDQTASGHDRSSIIRGAPMGSFQFE
jgi:hypothetical protein